MHVTLVLFVCLFCCVGVAVWPGLPRTPTLGSRAILSHHHYYSLSSCVCAHSTTKATQYLQVVCGGSGQPFLTTARSRETGLCLQATTTIPTPDTSLLCCWDASTFNAVSLLRAFSLVGR